MGVQLDNRAVQRQPLQRESLHLVVPQLAQDPLQYAPLRPAVEYSSGLVMQTRINGKVGYSLVSADGSRLEPLPDPPGPSAEWFQHTDVRGAAPSPDDPSLIAFGRTDVYDRTSERWLGVSLTEAAPAHVGPWATAGSDEAVLALPHPPHRVYPLLADLDETYIQHNLPSEADDA